MKKKIIYFLYKVFFYFDKIIKIITKKSILVRIKDLIEKDSYKKIKILDQELTLFIPNSLVEWRVNNLKSIEPETLEWINNFQSKRDMIFWDIGANIGLYSIYNAIKNKDSTTISFEPSTSNLRVLSRNISLNNFQEKIKIFSLPLSDKENSFSSMNESDFIEGGALHTFKKNYDFTGKKMDIKMSYKILSSSINYLLKNNILEIPDYIKIDVDGTEHLILEGGNAFLKDKKIKSFLIEINENFVDQTKSVLKIMEENDFKILHKKINPEFAGKNDKYSKTYNYIFIR